MRPEDETSEPELIAKAFQETSKEIVREGSAKALLKAELGYSRVARGAVPLIGVLYLESATTQKTFTPICISVISILASRATISFERVPFFETIRKTIWMIGHHQIGHMGRHRWNAPTLLSPRSSQCSRIFDFATNLNPVPFEAFRHGGRMWVEENMMPGTTFTFALPPRHFAQMSGSC
jgi:hypothetical protein